MTNTIDTLIKSYKPILVQNKVYYISELNDNTYININSLCTPQYTPYKWKRLKQVKDQLENFTATIPIYNHKNKGTWIHSSLYNLFAEWLNIKIDDSLDPLETILSQENQLDTYFKRIGAQPLRACRNTHYIILTDISSIYNKDLRSWKKTTSYKEYITINPEHCKSDNNSVDELGFRVTLTHPTLAELYLDYVDRYNGDNKKIIKEFIEYHKSFLENEAEEEIDEEKFIENEEEFEEDDIIIKEFNGNQIRQRVKDGYLCSTDMCKFSKKRIHGYNRSKSNIIFLQELEKEIGVSNLMESIVTGKNETRCTWVHPLVATHLACWLSPKFFMKVVLWVEEWKELNKKNNTEYYEEICSLEFYDNDLKESQIQQQYKELLNAQDEVETPVGFIDLLTEIDLIEIKTYTNWKNGIGQLICYGTFYPEHNKWLYLFDCENQDLEYIKQICEENNINLKLLY